MNYSETSAETPDWSREYKKFFQWRPSRSLLGSIRRYQKFKKRRGPHSWFLMRLAAVQHRFWTVVTGADIPLNSQIEGGLLLPHPNGVVIHSNAKIGPNCLIFQQVTLGSVASGRGEPILEGHVDIGAGAKVLGDVTLGKHCLVGANSVVLKDVPAHKTAVGIPAKIIN